MADDALATVACIREEMIKAANSLLPGMDPIRAFAAGGLHASALKALAGVDAALKLHGSVPWYCAASDCEHPEPDEDSEAHDDWHDDHTSGTGGIIVCLLTQVDSLCPECTRLRYDTLEPEGDDFVSAPCETYSAILAALAGDLPGKANDG
jgi:hypothetical protein